MTENLNIAEFIYVNSRSHPQRSAIVCGSDAVNYSDLALKSRTLARQIRPGLTHGRCGILGSRSIEACVAVLGIAWAGGTYVPLSLKYPEQRLVDLLDLLDLDVLIVDQAGFKLLSGPVRDHCPDLLLVPTGTPGEFEPEGRAARFAAGDDLARPVPVAPDHLAYIEFTSGTTGRPKGVMVSAGAVASYIDAMRGWYDFGPEDRAAETCDITFDLSVHNMLMIWQAGGCLYIMRPLDLVAPARFIARHAITTWLSVPSLVAMMKQTSALAPGSLPSLRISLFCGEPLPVEIARDWAAAAPNSVVDNIYGPTEATIACLRQPWTEPGVVTASRGIVAIGHAYPGMKAMIVDADRRPVADLTPGEIALSGRQLAEGYFAQGPLTAERFPMIDGERWYLTGDSGYRDADGVFHHLGRLDNQVKVNGHRVELEEIDMQIRRAAGTDMACAVAWPVSHGSAQGIVGFVAGGRAGGDEIRAALRDCLPPHMVPARIHVLETLPLNGNGKVDRKALLARLDHNEVPTQPELAS
ncbi:AMP-binding protein [Hoeflea sp. BAL378]|uniref:AMP-binding protein n=1 Tax=Hoeflea sp. BAL378 TaxID=1547437 RepID=UPI00068D28D9|nr:AMP-binding protein [Hoeflea sp. BAL378]